MSLPCSPLTRRLLAFLLLCLSPVVALPADVPPAFQNLVPAVLGDGLALVDVRKRCEDCAPWRVVEFRSRDAATPPWREKVSVRAGVTAMYAYPGTPYFANVKVEQSMPGMFDKDRAIVIQAIEHDYRLIEGQLASHLAADPAKRDKVKALLAPGKGMMAFERGTVHGIDYVSYTSNVLGLIGGTNSQIHFFVPGRSVIVSAYLLNGKGAKFSGIDDFLRLRADFIRAWTAFLARDGGASSPVGGDAAAGTGPGLAGCVPDMGLHGAI